MLLKEFLNFKYDSDIICLFLQVNSVGLTDSNASFRRKLSRREKKQLKKQEKSLKLKSENGDVNEKDGVAEKLYTGRVTLNDSISQLRVLCMTRFLVA